MKIARIFADIGGYYICDNHEDYLDARGVAYPSKAAALRAAADNYGGVQEPYTHAIGSGTYWQGIKRIPAKFRP